MDVKKIALSLLKKEIISQKLITKFQNKGIDVEFFDLNLTDNIFDLLELHRPMKQSDFDMYKKLMKIANGYSLSDHDKFEYLTVEIYEYISTFPKEIPYQSPLPKKQNKRKSQKKK